MKIPKRISNGIKLLQHIYLVHLIKYSVLKDKEFLYCGNKDFIVDFESNVILEYIDFKPYRDEMNRMFLDSLKEVKA